MGNVCSGDRNLSPLERSRRQHPIWARAFAAAAARTKQTVDKGTKNLHARREEQAREARKRAEEDPDADVEPDPAQDQKSTDAVLNDVSGELRQVSMMTPQLLDELWKKYVRHSDGIMSAGDMTQLIRDYLGHARLEVEALLGDMFKDRLRAIGMREDELQQYMQNPDVADALSASKTVLLRRFDFWLKDITKIVGRIQKKLDLDKNGSVSKEEFVSKFAGICDEVCNLEAIKEVRLRMSSFAPGVRPKSSIPDDALFYD